MSQRLRWARFLQMPAPAEPGMESAEGAGVEMPKWPRGRPRRPQLPFPALAVMDLWERGTGHPNHEGHEGHGTHHGHHGHEAQVVQHVGSHREMTHLEHHGSHEDSMSDLGLALISSGTTIFLAMISAIFAMRLFREMLRPQATAGAQGGGQGDMQGVLQLEIPGVQPFRPFSGQGHRLVMEADKDDATGGAAASGEQRDPRESLVGEEARSAWFPSLRGVDLWPPQRRSGDGWGWRSAKGSNLPPPPDRFPPAVAAKMWALRMAAAMAAVATADLPTVPPLPTVAAINEVAADVGDAVPTVPPLPDALPTAGEAATAITDALPTVAPEDTSITEKVSSKLSDIHENVKQVFSLTDDSHSGSPTFIVALILVVAAAFSLRVFAHYSFNDHNNAVREEKNRKEKRNAAEKEAQRQDAEEAASPGRAMPVMGQPQMLMGSGVYQQPMVVSGYQPQATSPTVSGMAGYAPSWTRPEKPGSAGDPVAGRVFFLSPQRGCAGCWRLRIEAGRVQGQGVRRATRYRCWLPVCPIHLLVSLNAAALEGDCLEENALQLAPAWLRRRTVERWEVEPEERSGGHGVTTVCATSHFGPWICHCSDFRPPMAASRWQAFLAGFAAMASLELGLGFLFSAAPALRPPAHAPPRGMAAMAATAEGSRTNLLGLSSLTLGALGMASVAASRAQRRSTPASIVSRAAEPNEQPPGQIPPVRMPMVATGSGAIDVMSKLLQDRILMLNGQVNDEMANVLVAQILYLANQDAEKDITIYINSPGGSVSAGMAIYDAMQFVPCDVSTVCYGMAASMGAFLLGAGTKGKRRSLPNARIMIHQPLGGAGGQAADIEIQAKEILFLREILNTYLADFTGKPLAAVAEDCDRDYYMTPEEASQYGIIDEVIETKSWPRLKKPVKPELQTAR
eukprot:s1259_g1.t1